jgi:hypothetical protein
MVPVTVPAQGVRTIEFVKKSKEVVAGDNRE